MNIKEIIPGLTQINLQIPRGGYDSFINSWLIKDNKRGRTVLIETGPASAVQRLVEDLKSLGADKIDYLIYTHIHLDHSGGAGQFHKIFPHTKIIAPIKGHPHLVDPEKLVIGSRANLGDICDAYGMPEPLPAEALLPDTYELDGLEIIDTPGHAPHHSSYVYDLDGTKILFAGEAGGCYFELNDGSIFMRPATPHKFFYETAMESLEKLIALQNIDFVCYPHSGCSRDSHELLLKAKTQMSLWRGIILALPEGSKTEDGVAAVLREDISLKQLEKLSDEDRKRESFYLRQSVDGYLGYAERNRVIPIDIKGD